MRNVPQYIQQLSLQSIPQQSFIGAPNALKGISDELGKIADDMYRKDVEIEKIRAKTTLDRKLDELYLANQNNPDAFKQQAEGFRKGFVGGIKDSDLADLFNAQYETSYRPFLNKTVENKIRLQDEEHELALRSAINTSIESGSRYVDGIQSNIPEHVMDTERALGNNMIAFDELLSARKSDGSFMFTPAQQIGFKNARDAKIQAKINEQIKLNQEMENLKQNDYATWGRLNKLTTQEIVDGQIARGVAPEDAQILGNEQAKQITENLGKIKDGGEFIIAVEGLKQQYPGYERNVVNEIARGMPDTHSIMLGMAQKPGVINYSEQIAVLSSVAQVKETDVDQAYKDTFGTPATDINAAVVSEMEDYLYAGTLETGASTELTGQTEAIRKMAKEYRLKNPGKSESEAAEFATQWLADNYKVGRINGQYVRFPTTDQSGMRLDPDELSDRLEDFMPFIDMKTLEDDLKDTAVKDYHNKATPFLNPNGDGYWFRSPRNEIVLDSAGNPSEIKIDTLAAGKTPLEKNKEKLRQMRDELSKLPYGEREKVRKQMLGIK